MPPPELQRDGRADDLPQGAGRGLRLCALYGVLYAVFTLALVTGIGMIFAAILLTLAQVRVTRPPDGGKGN